MKLLLASNLSVTLALLASGQTVNHVVDVGLNGLVFTPDQVQAGQGDTVTFVYHPGNHSTTQSAFDAPCTPLIDTQTGTTGFDAGFHPVSAGIQDLPTFTIEVTTADEPIWAFCRQATHCATGMVFAINPTANQTFDRFQANARSTVPGAAIAAAPSSLSLGADGATPVSTGVTASGAASSTSAAASSSPASSSNTATPSAPANSGAEALAASSILSLGLALAAFSFA